MTQGYDRRRRRDNQPEPMLALQPFAPGRATRTAALQRPETPVPSAIARPRQAPITGTRRSHDEHTCSAVTASFAPIDEASGTKAHTTFNSGRFAGDSALEQVAAGRSILKTGDTGLSISRVQSALADAGHVLVRSGCLDEATGEAIKTFQLSRSLAPSGCVDHATLNALDELFAGHMRHATIAMAKKPHPGAAEGSEFPYGAAPGDLLVGTHEPSATEGAEAQAVLAPARESDRDTGRRVEFDEEGLSNGKGPYKKALSALVNEIVSQQFDKIAKGKREAHSDPKNLHEMDELIQVGQASKTKTDTVFGAYRKGRAFNASNLRDRWAVQEERIGHLLATREAGGHDGRKAGAQLQVIARWRVEKIVNSYTKVEQLNAAYGAVASRKREKRIIDAVITETAHQRESELLEIHKGWGGAADSDSHQIFIQLFKSPTASANRAFLWRTFQMLIHEYMHTLTHSRYRDYSEKVSDADGTRGHTLREGVTECLTKTVLSTVDYNDKVLRQQVEGPYHEPGTVEPPPKYKGYEAEAARAEQVIGLVGALNMYGAYFLGHIELIGGSL